MWAAGQGRGQAVGQCREIAGSHVGGWGAVVVGASNKLLVLQLSVVKGVVGGGNEGLERGRGLAGTRPA